jgi:Hg(II)-responsive transcriptional regulator
MSTVLSTSTLAARAGVNLQTVRYYERRGLLPEPPRTAAGYRRYGPDALVRLRFIRRAQELGFSLDEIEELLALRVDPNASRADVRRRAEVRIADVRDRIRDLQRMLAVLEALHAACHGDGPAQDCPILHALEDPDEAARHGH